MGDGGWLLHGGECRSRNTCSGSEEGTWRGRWKPRVRSRLLSSWEEEEGEEE